MAFFSACINQNKSISPTVKAVLDKLNSWDIEELSVVECPQDHLGRVASGETNGWILSYKEELKGLGVKVRWNCEKKAYDVVTEEQTLSPMCGCRQ